MMVNNRSLEDTINRSVLEIFRAKTLRDLDDIFKEMYLAFKLVMDKKAEDEKKKIEIGALEMLEAMHDPMGAVVNTLNLKESIELLERIQIGASYYYAKDHMLAERIAKLRADRDSLTNSKSPTKEEEKNIQMISNEIITLEKNEVAIAGMMVGILTEFREQVAGHIAQIIPEITNDPQTAQTDMINAIEQKHANFVEAVKSAEDNMQSATLRHISAGHFIFIRDHRLKPLNKFLKQAEEKGSQLMYYIYGNHDGHIKTKNGNIIPALKTTMEEIQNDRGSDDEKFIRMRQVILDMYFQIRKDQGWFDSRLADELEHFLVSPEGEGLNLRKYGKNLVPHQVSRTDISPLIKDLENKQFFTMAYRKLKNEFRYFPPNERKKIEPLLESLENIRADQDLPQTKKYHAMKHVMAFHYGILKEKTSFKQTLAQSFFGEKNVVNLLEKFFKQEFNIDKDQIKTFAGGELSHMPSASLIRKKNHSKK